MRIGIFTCRRLALSPWSCLHGLWELRQHYGAYQQLHDLPVVGPIASRPETGPQAGPGATPDVSVPLAPEGVPQ
jgi:hypothetical protein